MQRSDNNAHSEKFRPEQLVVSMPKVPPGTSGNLTLIYNVTLSHAPDQAVASAQCIIFAKSGTINITRLDVLESLRKRGIGTHLLHYICEFAKKSRLGITFITDEIIPGTQPSTEFYSKFFEKYYQLDRERIVEGGLGKGQDVYKISHQQLVQSAKNTSVVKLSVFASGAQNRLPLFESMTQQEAQAKLQTDPANQHPGGLFLLRHSNSQPGKLVVEFFRLHLNGRKESVSFLVPGHFTEKNIRGHVVPLEAILISPQPLADSKPAQTRL